jgi:hypothetical protein
VFLIVKLEVGPGSDIGEYRFILWWDVYKACIRWND